jgi:type IV secretion system protein VirB11
MLARLARQIAALTHQGVSRENPLLAANLPDRSRIQVVAPPATRGPLALAIRRQVVPSLTLQDYAAGGHFADTSPERSRQSADEELCKLVAARSYPEALAVLFDLVRTSSSLEAHRRARPPSSMLCCGRSRLMKG